MNIEVLLATLNQKNHDFFDLMNLDTDVIVGNQCDKNEIKEEIYKGHKIKWLSFNERGVGLNRNNCLMRSTADIILFSDDDVVYVDNYSSIINRFFEKYNNADIVIFNMHVKRNDEEWQEIVKTTKKISRYEASSFGTYCIAAKRESVRFANIYFHLDFGGGAKYSCGEDTIFLQDCFKERLNVYTCKDIIGSVDHGISTWFKGYNEKYFIDKGILFKHLYPSLYKIISLYHCIKHRKLYKDFGVFYALKKMIGY